MRFWDSMRRATEGQKTRRQGRYRLPRAQQPLRHRSLRVDPLEERQLLTVSAADPENVLVNVDLLDPNNDYYRANMQMIAGQSLSSDNDGDFVVVWSQQDKVSYGQTNSQWTFDWNIYGRYYTDEVQQITVANSQSSVNLLWGGTKVVEKITFTNKFFNMSGYWSASATDFYFKFDNDFDGVSETASKAFNFNEENATVSAVSSTDPSKVDSPQYNAALLQSYLRSQFSSLSNVEVRAVSSTEFLIWYDANMDWVAQSKSQPLISAEDNWIYGLGTECLSQPYMIRNIPIVSSRPNVTALNIEDAFQRDSDIYSNYITSYTGKRVSVSYAGTTTSGEQKFNITFTGSAAKTDQATLVFVDANCNPLSSQPVRTLKQPSARFRVNADEPDDLDTIRADCYDQTQASVAIDADGEFIVTWTSEVPDSITPGSGTDVFMRRFSVMGWQDTFDATSTDGLKYGYVTQEIRSLVSCDARISQSVTINDTSGLFRLSIPVAVTGSAGTSTTGNITVSSNTATMAAAMQAALEGLGMRDVKVTVKSSSGPYVFEVSYLATYGTSLGTDQYDLKLVRGLDSATQSLLPAVNGNCTPLAAEYYTTRLNDDTVNPQGTPTIQMNDDGTFVVVWAGTGYCWDYGGAYDADGVGDYDDTGAGQEYSYFNNVYVQPFTRDGERQGNPVILSDDITDTFEHSDPYIAISNDGYVAIAWTYMDTGGNDDDWTNADSRTGQGYLAIVSPSGTRFTSKVGGASSLGWQITADFDSANNLLLSWTEVSNGACDEDKTFGIRMEEFAMLDTSGAFAPSVTIAESKFWVNSAGNPPGVGRHWTDQQSGSQAMIDADGDITITYEGFGPATNWGWEGYGVMYTSFDASADQAMTVLETDEVINTDQDGTNASYYVSIPARASGGSVNLRVYDWASAKYSDISVSLTKVEGGNPAFDTGKFADDLEKALEGLAYWGGRGDTSVAVNYVANPLSFWIPTDDICFEIEFTDYVHNIDIYMSQSPDKASELTTDVQGEKLAPTIVRHTYGDLGRGQYAASADMEPDGDWVAVWMQNEKFSDSYFYSYDPNYRSGNVTNNNILYRRYNETTDTAGPNITELRLTDGTIIVDANQTTRANVNQVVVTFDEEMWTTGDDSVENVANWVFARDGVTISGGVVSVEYGLNKAFELGLAKVPSNKWEAVVTLDSNGDASDGPQTLSSGTYTLTALYPIDDVAGTPANEGRSGLRDAEGNPLGKTGYVPNGEEQSRQLKIVAYVKDYGDAPMVDSNGNATQYYTTGANAACHAVPTLIYLGDNSPDVDSDGMPNSTATGDDSSGMSESDEDGVNFAAYDSVYSPGQNVSFTVTVNAGASGYVEGWIDWNGDGKWADYSYVNKAGQTVTVKEHLLQQTVGTSSKPIEIRVDCQVPENASLGTVYSRFRVSTQGVIDSATGYLGFAEDGEVEDYAINVVATPRDYGDAPVDGTTGTNAAYHKYDPVTKLHLGSSIDYEADGQPNPTATGDDLVGRNPSDEDGVTDQYGQIFGAKPIIIGEATTFSVQLSADCYVDVWIWYDGNGDGVKEWTDASSCSFITMSWDTVNTDAKLPQGTRKLTWVVNSESIDTFVRFRANSTDANLAATGAANDGEVEDYAVSIVTGAGVISGTVYKDLNADGEFKKESGEDPWVGYEVRLYRDGDFISKVTTDANGVYQFTALPRGDYSVRIVTAADYIVTTEGGNPIPVHFSSSSDTAIDQDFGLFRKAKVSVSDAKVVEGSNGKTQVQVTLHLTDSFGAPVEVYYSTYSTDEANAATAGVDYTAVSNGHFTFTPQSAPEGVWSTQTLTQNTYNDYDYKASGNYIVWSTYDGSNWDVFLYDAATQQTYALTDELSGDHRYPTVSGDNIVWTGKLAGESDYEIYTCSIADIIDGNAVATRLTDNSVDDLEPALSGNRLVWTTTVGVNTEIYYLEDVTNPGTPVNLSNNGDNDSGAVISGTHVAWTSYDGYDKEIYLVDLDDMMPWQLTYNAREDGDLDISDEAVVWESHDGVDYEVMAYVFDSAETIQVTDNSYNDVQPAISGSVVVWRGSDGTNTEIMAYDLADYDAKTDIVAVNLSNNNYANERPQILGDRVVWHAYAGPEWDVFYLDISAGLSASAGKATDISANAQSDWYPQVTEDFVAWRSYIKGNYEIVLATQMAPEVTQTLTIDIIGDSNQEMDEFFFVKLDSSPQADLVEGKTVAQVTILDDDKMDYGDAPNSYGTLVGSDGARHWANTDYYLGAKIDTDTAARPSVGANGDDTNGIDDEDGVVVDASWVGGTVASFKVTAHCPSGGTGYLNVWVDLNGDGDWGEANEQIVVDEAMTAATGTTSVTKTFQFYVPANIVSATSYMRVRFCDDMGLSTTGTADSGEVEDYAIALKANPYLNAHALSVMGTAGNDSFTFDLAATMDSNVLNAISDTTYQMTYNGATYYYPAALVNSVVFQGGAGSDTVTLIGSIADDSVWLWPTQVHLVTTDLDLWAYASEKITVSSGGGTDSVRLYDSSKTETFVSTPTSASMSGTGFTNTAKGFVNVYGFSSGGSDTATLTGSADIDTLDASAKTTTLSGSGYFTRVSSFRTVTVNGTSGADVASLEGSTAADTCVASPTQVTLKDTAGTAYTIVANGFKAVRVDGLTGTDKGTLTDSTGKDLFVGKPDQSTLSGNGFSNSLLGFEVVSATATAGGDSAYLYDSAGNDTFTASPTLATMKSSGGTSSLEAKNFAYVSGIASTGTNTAKLSDSAGNDTYTASPSLSTLRGTSYTLDASGFQVVTATASKGTDIATFYDSEGDDTFQAGGTKATDVGKVSMNGASFSNQGSGFDKYVAYSTAGGSDTANFYDSKGNDSFVAGGKTAADAGKATMTVSGYSYQGNGFAKINAYAVLGGTDTASFYDSASDATFQANGATLQALAQATMTGSSYSYLGKGFDKYYAYATAGTHGVATLNGSTGVDTFTGSAASARLASGSVYDYNLSNFAEVASYGKGGKDSATLSDSSANDVLMAQGTWAELSKADKAYSLLVDGYKSVKATSSNKGDTKAVSKALNYVLTATGKWA